MKGRNIVGVDTCRLKNGSFFNAKLVLLVGNHSFMTFKSTHFCDHTKSLFSNLNIMRRKQFWNSNQRVSIFSPIWTPTPNISTGFGILMVVPCCTDLLTLLPTYCFKYFVDIFVPDKHCQEIYGQNNLCKNISGYLPLPKVLVF